jgi:hypothetical protein
MAAVTNSSHPFAQPTPLPVALSLEPPAVAGPDLPVLSMHCTLPIGATPLSWLELLGER